MSSGGTVRPFEKWNSCCSGYDNVTNTMISLACTGEGNIWRGVYNLATDNWVWTKVVYGAYNWYHICCNTTASRVYACDYGGFIWGSSDSGVTWNLLTQSGNANWSSMSCDPSGRLIIASASEGNFSISPDFGSSWVELISNDRDTQNLQWSSISAIFNTVNSNDPSLLNGRSYIVTSTAGASTFPGATNPVFPGKVYQSNGVIGAAGGLTTSATIMISTIDSVFVSTDFCRTLTLVSNFGCNAISNNGSTGAPLWVGAGTGGNIITCSDSNTFAWVTQVGSSPKNWSSVECDGLGFPNTHVVACDYGGYVWTSNNAGLTWTEQTSLGVGNWNAVAAFQNPARNAIYLACNYGKDIYYANNNPTFGAPFRFAGVINNQNAFSIASNIRDASDWISYKKQTLIRLDPVRNSGPKGVLYSIGLRQQWLQGQFKGIQGLNPLIRGTNGIGSPGNSFTYPNNITDGTL
jgi:hypothetical protein